MSKRDKILIVDPDGKELEFDSLMIGIILKNRVVNKEDSAKRIAHHFAKVQYCAGEALKDISKWPRTYKIVMFDGEEFEVKIGAQKTIQLFIDNEEE